MKVSYVITDNSVEKIWVVFGSERLGICRKDKSTSSYPLSFELNENETMDFRIATIILNRREASKLVDFIQKEFLKGEDNG